SVDDEGYRHLFDVRPDATVLLFSLAVTAGAGVLFGLLPALQAGRTNLNLSLKGGEDVQRDEGRDRYDDDRQADHRLTLRPGHLLELRPRLLREPDEPELLLGHHPASARQERLELSTAGFGDQCSAS